MEFMNDTNYLDQHFLVDRKVVNAFIDAANLNIYDIVVEVGPGDCSMSEIIAKKVKTLILIEKDNKLEHFVNVLKDKYKNVSIIWDNALSTYIPPCDKILSALPYSITEPFIEKLIRCDFNEAILIVGNNFASAVYEKKLNKLSLLTNSFFKFEKILEIQKESFDPQPRVVSALVSLKKIERGDLINNPKMFIIRELFFNRSRKLRNNLTEALIELEKQNNKKLTKKESKAIVNSFNLDKHISEKNIENMSNEDFEVLYNSLKFDI